MALKELVEIGGYVLWPETISYFLLTTHEYQSDVYSLCMPFEFF